jgi:bifunctional non-homologous end joining protein LigD
MPKFIPPQLATLKQKVPAGAAWLHEAKFDGYRLQLHKRDNRVVIYTRSGLDWTNRFKPIAQDAAKLPIPSAIIDAEIISADAEGRASFSALQDDLKTGRTDRMVCYAFDLLYAHGVDLRASPLIERRHALTELLARANAQRIWLSDHFEDGAALFEHARAMGLEGIVSKRVDAPYRSGRGETWIKIKATRRDQFVVVGFAPEGPNGLAKLRLARRDGDRLIYVGRVGTGWDRKAAATIRRTLTPLARPTSPLSERLRKADTTWVAPQYVAEVEYLEFSSDGMLRHPSFKGLAPVARP